MKLDKLITFAALGGMLVLSGCGDGANNKSAAPLNNNQQQNNVQDQNNTGGANNGNSSDSPDDASNADAGNSNNVPVSVKSGSKLYSLEDTVVMKNGIAVITNAKSIAVIVNKKRNLPSDYEPSDLVEPNVKFSFSGDNPKKLMRKEAAKALEQLFAKAKDDKIELAAVSGYRSYATQKAIFDRNAKQKGEDEANKTSAHPGQSEHQTGLAMDVSSKSANYGLEQNFGDTKEGKWLKKNASKFGFVIRYPKGKENITGYTYEPWHVRYLGKELAQEIDASGLTVEEFFQQSTPVDSKKKN